MSVVFRNMKQVCLNPALLALRGNCSAYDHDGHKGIFRFRQSATGKLTFGVGQPKRNTVLKPYTEDEKAVQTAFKDAAAKRKQINLSVSLSDKWLVAYKNAQATGTTHCLTPQGFITSCLIKGMVTEDLMPNLG